MDDDEEWSDDDSAETITCPQCGGNVYEDAPQCPACGEWITPSSGALAGRPLWFVAGGLMGVAAVIVVLIVLGF